MALAFGTFPTSTPRATLTVALALAMFGALLGFLRPVAAACGLAGVLPLAAGLTRLLGDHSGAPVLTALALATLGTALAGFRSRGDASPLPPLLRKFATWFLVLAAASAAASIARGETLYLLFRGRIDPLPLNALGMTAADRSRDAVLAFLGLVLLLFAVDVFSRVCLAPGGRDRLLLALAAGAAIAFAVAGVGRFLRFDEGSSPWSAMHRYAGTFTDPNALGVGVGLLVPLLVAALPQRGIASDGPRRGFALLALGGAPFALEASGSRTGLLLIAVVAVAGGVGLARARLVSRNALLLALVAATLAAGALVPALPRGGGVAVGGLLQRLGAGLSSSSFADFVDHRTLFWGTALEMTGDEPLSGIGLGGFPYEFPAAYARRHAPLGVTDGATNAFLEVAAECGLPGLALALVAVAPLLARACDEAFSRERRDGVARAAGAALLGLFVACQTGSHLRFPEIGLLAGLVAGFLFVPRAGERFAPPGEKPADGGHIAALLAVFGAVGALAATIPTAAPDAPFRLGNWIGLYGPAPTPGPYRWAGPSVCRRILPSEASVSFRVENARPDGRPVTLVLSLDGRAQPAIEIAGASSRDVTVAIPSGTRVLRVTGHPDFVPHELTGSADFRRLCFRLEPEGTP